MIHSIVQVCRDHPEIVIFLAIAFGYLLGKVRFFGISLGSTVWVLVAALVLGQLKIDVAPLVKTIGFVLFIFCIGYKVGPEFFGGLKKGGLNYLWLSLIVAVVGLLVTVGLAKFFRFDPGSAAGLLAGAMTQTAAIGTAEGAIKGLSVSAAQKATFTTNIAVAYGITYIFGVAGVVIFVKVVPRIYKISVKEASAKLLEEMTGKDLLEGRPELFSWHKQLDLRVFRVEKTAAAEKTVKDIEALFPARVAVDRMKHGGSIVDNPSPETVVQSGDLVVVVGGRAALLEGEELIGPEADDASLTGLVGEVLDVCTINKDAVGRTLGELSKEHGHGCFLKRMMRQGRSVPITRDTVVKKCDVLQLVGAREDVERAAKFLGYPERPTSITDLVSVGFGIVIGTLIGLIALPVAGVPITLGTGGGILVMGLVFGWLRSVHPTFGQIPSGAQWIFTDLGLNLFIACLGITAGPQALQTLRTTGVPLLIAGIFVTILPIVAGLLFGRFVVRMNPILLLGALTGAETSNPAINALVEDAECDAPILGFTVPYAIGNVLLTVWGTVVVNLM